MNNVGADKPPIIYVQERNFKIQLTLRLHFTIAMQSIATTIIHYSLTFHYPSIK